MFLYVLYVAKDTWLKDGNQQFKADSKSAKSSILKLTFHRKSASKY